MQPPRATIRVSLCGLASWLHHDVLDRRDEAFDQGDRGAFAFIEHPSFPLREIAEVIYLGEYARECSSDRFNEAIKRLVLVITGLFRDAPLYETLDLLKPVTLSDGGIMGGIGFSL